jgi:phosphotriesterase-related protein
MIAPHRKKTESPHHLGAVMTVLGPVRPEDLGKVLSHEHLFIDLFRIYQPHRDMQLADARLMEIELQRFRDIGGGTVVDLTTPDIGRDPARLKSLSLATGVHIVMGSGHYRSPFYRADLDRITTCGLTNALLRDITDGDSGVRPGVIGEIGTDANFVAALEERVHRAAARAALTSGLSVVTHSLGSDVGTAQLELLLEEGLSPTRVAIGHADTFPHWGYHEHLLGRGAYLVFDTLRGTNDYETNRTIGLLLRAIDAGFEDKILLSHDVCTTAHLHNYGGQGFTYVHGDFMNRLRAEGLTPEVIEKLGAENAQRFLTIRRPSHP